MAVATKPMWRAHFFRRRLRPDHLSVQFLRELGLEEENLGAYAGGGKWTGGGSVSTTLNPSTGKSLLNIRQANEADYDACLAAMEAARKPWAEVRRAFLSFWRRGGLSGRDDWPKRCSTRSR